MSPLFRVFDKKLNLRYYGTQAPLDLTSSLMESNNHSLIESRVEGFCISMENTLCLFDSCGHIELTVNDRFSMELNTGLKDKHGNYIFENDVLRVSSEWWIDDLGNKRFYVGAKTIVISYPYMPDLNNLLVELVGTKELDYELSYGLDDELSYGRKNK